jgi:hypothetical protein
MTDVLFVPLAVIPLGAVIYLALSKKSGPRTRMAALIALGVMILSVIVSLMLIFGGPGRVEGDAGIPPGLPAGEAVPPGNDLWILLAFAGFLAVLCVVVAVLSIRERRRLKEAPKKSGPRAA